MPLSYILDPGDRLVRISGNETPTVAEMVELFAAVPHDPLYESGFDFLCDCREMQRMFSLEEIQAAAGLFRQWYGTLGRCRCALVVSQAGAFAGARLVAAMVADTNITLNVFYTTEGARAWLRSPATVESRGHESPGSMI